MKAITLSRPTVASWLFSILLFFPTLLHAQELPPDVEKGMKKKDPMAYVHAGDLALARRDAGAACQYYEQAIYFDPDCATAYLKWADVYKTTNPSQAISKLQELKKRQPDNAAANHALADVYYAANRFADAAKAYETVINGEQATNDDRLHYAFALFMNHQFDRSLAIVKQGLAKDPRNAPLNRLAMYNYTDLKQYNDAAQAADLFFHHTDSVHYSTLDSLYQTTLWQGMSEMYRDQHDYPRAINAYLTYYTMLKPQEQTTDHQLQLGRLYYAEGTDTLAAGATPYLCRTALTRADSVFRLAVARDTTNYVATFWRARTNSALDPETTQGQAKPYYEAVATRLQADGTAIGGNRKSALIECYSYLGYYYLLTNNVSRSESYWNQILTLDPDNAVAKRAMTGINKLKK
jgi:tetratricopeptide (TPR) repeat protein